MQPFTTLTGIVAPLDLPDVDTDQIIPKQFLKRIERTGFGQFLFFDWRFSDGGRLNSDFEMNAPWYRGAAILIARSNFGCGSSREHAPWALLDYGIRCLIAPSFADIFYNNCFKNGLLPIPLPEGQVEELFQRVRAAAKSETGYPLTVDLFTQRCTAPDGLAFDFEVAPFHRRCLLAGQDDIGRTLQHDAAIGAYEAVHPHIAPPPARHDNTRSRNCEIALTPAAGER